MKKELVVSNQTAAAIASYTGKLVSDISFAELSDIIDKIANNKEELTDGMRAAATTYAEKWDELVVERLDVKYQRLETLKNFFSQTGMSYYTAGQACCSMVHHWTLKDYDDDPIVITVINMLQSSDNKTWHTFAAELEAVVEEVESLKEEAAKNWKGETP